MKVDLYTKCILTVIAIALVVLAIEHAGQPVSAQAPASATPVVITGIDLARGTPALPVDVARPVPVVLTDVRATVAVPVTVPQPLRITSDRPLQVDVVRTPAQARPGF